MTRVAIVAGAAAVRAELEAVVARSESLVLVAAAASAGRLAADPGFPSAEVVLLHTTTPEALARDLDTLPPLPVVVLVPGRASAEAVPVTLAAGARGVLPDDAAGEEIVAALEAAAVGLVVVPSEQVGGLLASRQPTSEARDFTPRSARPDVRPPPLTPREREILIMLADGLPNKLIAARLGISDHTVKTHLEAVFDKLGASTRAEAVARGVRLGLLLL